LASQTQRTNNEEDEDNVVCCVPAVCRIGEPL
jgi:hypothetical protein